MLRLFNIIQEKFSTDFCLLAMKLFRGCDEYINIMYQCIRLDP